VTDREVLLTHDIRGEDQESDARRERKAKAFLGGFPTFSIGPATCFYPGITAFVACIMSCLLAKRVLSESKARCLKRDVFIWVAVVVFWKNDSTLFSTALQKRI
jgi:hypothetical protein